MKFLVPLLLIMNMSSAPDDTLKRKLDKLFEEASLWQVGENVEKVKKAREKLIEMGEVAVKFIIKEKLKTESTLERRAIKHVVKNLRREALLYLREALKSDNDTIRRNAIWLVGEVKDTQSVDTLILMLKSKMDLKTTLYILNALGKIGVEKAVEPIAELKDTSEERIREAVASSLYKIRGEKALYPLLTMLDDSFFTVRGTAARGIVRKIRWSKDTLLSILKSGDKKKIVEILKAMSEEKDSLKGLDELHYIRIKSALVGLLSDSSWVIRGYAVRALRSAFLQLPDVRHALLDLMEREVHPFVIRELEEALDKTNAFSP